MKVRKYDESDISYFENDIKKLRAKPQMYLGPTDNSGIFQMLNEGMSNVVDEYRAGRGGNLWIKIEGDVFTIVDDGAGIPVKIHKKAKISTLTHVLTSFQSSGKMEGNAYQSAIGTHGIGIKLITGLSKFLEVWTYRADAGGWHYTKFEKGTEKQKVAKSKPPKISNLKVKNGTVFRFSPDPEIFGKHKLQKEQLENWCELSAFMNAKLKIHLDYNGKVKEWYSKRGIEEYLEQRIAKLEAEALNKKVFFYSSQNLDLALSFTNVEDEHVQYFTNTVRNVDKGFHADDLMKAIMKSLEPFKGKLSFTVGDVCEGLIGVLNYKINAPQFSSQTKEKLVDIRVKGACFEECLKALSEYWKSNKSLAKQICQRAAELRKSTEAFKADKKLIRQVNTAKKSMSKKLADVVGKVPRNQCEIFLVEGDSAGGTAKQARDKSFQAVFPLRGKPLNVMEAAKDKINKNEEIAGILAALNLNLGDKNMVKKMRYGKVIFLADPDIDGKHINVLLLTMFQKFAPELFKEGIIHLVRSPEYHCDYKGKKYFGMTKKSIYKQIGSKPKLEIRHIKGWGEIDAKDMGIALDPGLRTLIRIEPMSSKEYTQFTQMMGKSAAYRQKMLVGNSKDK